MKKILGIFIFTLICILGLCSCASPEQKAINQDLVDRIAKISDTGKEIEVEGKRVCLYSLTDNEIPFFNGSGWFETHTFTDFTRLVQYNNYFEIYVGDTLYTFSNTVAGYIIY